MAIDLDFNDRAVLVYGAETAVGHSIARHLAQRGAAVMLGAADAACAPDLPDVAEAWRAEGLDVAAIGEPPPAEPAARGADIARVAIESLGRLDAVVGIMPDGAGTPDSAALAQGLLTPAALIDAVLPHMRGRGSGRIAWVVEAAGAFGQSRRRDRAVASAGLAALMRTAAIESRTADIGVNVLAALIAGDGGPSVFDEEPLIDRALFTPAAVMPLLAYLCHPACRLTGEMLTAGGGRFGRIFAATAPGLFNPVLSDGGVAAAIDEIMSTEGFVIPRRAADELIFTHV